MAPLTALPTTVGTYGSLLQRLIWHISPAPQDTAARPLPHKKKCHPLNSGIVLVVVRYCSEPALMSWLYGCVPRRGALVATVLPDCVSASGLCFQ